MIYKVYFNDLFTYTYLVTHIRPPLPLLAHLEVNKERLVLEQELLHVQTEEQDVGQNLVLFTGRHRPTHNTKGMVIILIFFSNISMGRIFFFVMLYLTISLTGKVLPIVHCRCHCCYCDIYIYMKLQ